MKHGFLSRPSTGAPRRLHFTDWGEAGNGRVLLCAHGLTRSGRDFDALAEAMRDRYRVICPDFAGRGESDWLADKSGYNYPTYLDDMAALIEHVRPDVLHWVGTSMGGIVGMMVAAQPGTRISRMVVNDVGAFIPKEALARIGTYVGRAATFPSMDAAVAAMRLVSPFGPLDDDDWRRITEPLLKPDGKGGYQLRYDPAIGDVFKRGPIGDVDLSATWNAIRCPVLVTRGADSDLLLKSTYEAMLKKPGVRGVEFARTGHSPMFQDEASITLLREFLLEAD